MWAETGIQYSLSLYLFFSLKISNASKTEESRPPPDKGNFKNATPFLSLPTATASDNMQSYDYWPCAANFTVTQPTLDSTLIPTTLSSRRGLLTVQKPWCLLYLCSLFRPVERPANRLWKGPHIHKLPNFSTACDQIDFPLQLRPRPQTARRFGDVRRGRGQVGKRALPIGWLFSPGPIHLRSLRLDYAVSSVLMVQALKMYPRHDNNWGSPELNENNIRACHREQSRRYSGQNVIQWRQRDYNQCHCWRGWHRVIYFRRHFAEKRACPLAINNRLVSPRGFISAALTMSCLFVQKATGRRTLKVRKSRQQKRKTPDGPWSCAVSLPCGYTLRVTTTQDFTPVDNRWPFLHQTVFRLTKSIDYIC